MPYETQLFSNGERLAATVTTPGDTLQREKRFPAVVLCHGHSRDRNDGLDRLAQVLSDAGFVTVRFDFRGNGCQSEKRYRLYCDTDMIADMRSAVSFAEALPFVDADRIGVSGISLGACMTIIACGLGDERIRSAAVMAAPDDMEEVTRKLMISKGKDYEELKHWLREDAKIASMTGHSQLVNRMALMYAGTEAEDVGILEYLEQPGFNPFETLDSYAALIRIQPIKYVSGIECPMFFLHGKDDQGLPWEGSWKMYELLSKRRSDARYKLYEGIDHNMAIHPKREEVFTDITDWFRETL